MVNSESSDVHVTTPNPIKPPIDDGKTARAVVPGGTRQPKPNQNKSHPPKAPEHVRSKVSRVQPYKPPKRLPFQLSGIEFLMLVLVVLFGIVAVGGVYFYLRQPSTPKPTSTVVPLPPPPSRR